MELILENVTLKTSKMAKTMVNVNYVFKSGVTFCNGISGKFLKEMLFQERKLENGVVMVSDKATKKDVGIVGWETYNDFNKSNIVDEIKFLINEYSLEYGDTSKRLTNSLVMAGLNESYTNVYFSDLSSGELKKISLAITLFINPKIMIFDYYDKNLSDGEVNYLKKLLHKLATDYNKNIIICSDNISPFLSIINNIVIFRNGKIVFKGNNKDFYNDEVYKYIDKPDIVSFTQYANSMGHKLENYLDIKELIKAIYRDVENK